MPDPIGDAGGDSDWYGYCLDDPVNGVDLFGLEAKEGALGRIVRDATIGAGVGVWRGSSFGWTGALAGGIIGSSAGTLRGVVKEYPPLRGWIDDSKKKVLHELTDGKADRMHQIRWKNYDASYYKQTK